MDYGHDVAWPLAAGRAEPLGFAFYPELVARAIRLPRPMKVLRVWAFGDDRAGNLAGLEPRVFQVRCVRDLAAFMEASARAAGPDSVVIWVLWDFALGDGQGSPHGGRFGEQRRLLLAPRGAERAWRLVGPCLQALQRRYGRRIVWEIMNEPLNGKFLSGRADTFAGLERFLEGMARRILAMGGRVTVGFRTRAAALHDWRGLLGRIEAARRRFGLSPDHLLVQFHHYPSHETRPDSSLASFRADRFRRRLGLDPRVPVLLGEFRPETGYRLGDFYQKGFAGALVWTDERLRLAPDHLEAQAKGLLSGRTKPFSPFLCKQPPLEGRRQEAQVQPGPRPRPRPLPRGLPSRRAVALDLNTCRISHGLGIWASWRRCLGFSCRAFRSLSLGPQGLAVRVRGQARPPSPNGQWWHGSGRCGQLLCQVPGQMAEAGGGVDLRGFEVSVEVSVPPALVSSPSGLQVLLEDASGRRMHGPWTPLSAAHPGRYQLVFRPGSATPGLGHRDPGFDPTRVRFLGLGWAAATYANLRVDARILVHRVSLRRLGRSWGPGRDSFYRTVAFPPARVLRLGRAELSCRFQRALYPYFQGIQREDSPGQAFRLHLDATSRYARRAALWTKVAAACRQAGRPAGGPGPKGRDGGSRGRGGRSGPAGREADEAAGRPARLAGLLDLRGCFLRPILGLSGGPAEALDFQLLLADDRGGRCYVGQRARRGGRWRLDPGPDLCAAGQVDLARLARLGVAFRALGRRWVGRVRLAGFVVSCGD